ncbi:hypothetical protein [Burkholderia glumae]|uniref:Uncharacterized protein n=1 Tax=Burkholderia glumae TaxID=337 RepID=A0ABY5BAS9_BURGL|nr:hypothetical protein [Burkholderia glumae]USS44118.1 hypothetical protein NFI99_12565 [Burkholderia glumae]UVT05838.1 hypothetical protein EFP20_30225 [Burkholderia glumae]
MKRAVSRSEVVAVEIDGCVYEGEFRVESKVVIVEAPFGSGSTHLGSQAPVSIARMLLREIVAGAITRGDL